MIKLDGAALAKIRLEALGHLSSTLSPKPTLAIISVGDDPASAIYVRKKLQMATKAGFQSIHHALDTTCTPKQLHDVLHACSHDAAVHGILLQLPLPPHLSAPEAILFISPDKDVDGLHPLNMGRLQLGKPLQSF